jgi:hypothetical protein
MKRVREVSGVRTNLGRLEQIAKLLGYSVEVHHGTLAMGTCSIITPAGDKLITVNRIVNLTHQTVLYHMAKHYGIDIKS